MAEHHELGRYERGLDAYASQFGIAREEVPAWFAERFGERSASRRSTRPAARGPTTASASATGA